MKRNFIKRIRAFLILILLVFAIYFFLPAVVIEGPQNWPSSWGKTIEFKNNRNSDGSKTTEQIDEYFNGFPELVPMDGKSVLKYPLLMWNKIDYVTFGGMVYMVSWWHPDKTIFMKWLWGPRSENRGKYVNPRSEIIVHNSDLYFFRIYAKCTNEGDWESITIKKYPWSKKKSFTSLRESWPYAWEGLSSKEGFDRLLRERQEGSANSDYVDKFIVE